MSVDLVAAMRSHGLRITAARRAICAVLEQLAGAHVSASDVAVRAAGEAPGVDASTVYRTLETLERLGLVRHVHLGHGPGVYHLVDGAPHHHLVCESCGRTVDVDPDEVRRRLGPLGERYGFDLGGPHFAITGRCHDCVR